MTRSVVRADMPSDDEPKEGEIVSNKNMLHANMLNNFPHWAYGDESYWNSRYSMDTGPFDWYQSYSGLAFLIRKYIPKTNKILMVGCGNAVISEDMVKDGYKHIVNIDISQVVIDAMKIKYKHLPQLEYHRMDVRDMKDFEDAQFDTVLDKGMFDSLMCGSIVPYSSSSMLSEVRRVLKPGGIYVLVTYGDPQARLPYLKSNGVQTFHWDIKLHVTSRPSAKTSHESTSRFFLEPVSLTEDLSLGAKLDLEDPNLHYVYICTKEGAHDHGKNDNLGGNDLKKA